MNNTLEVMCREAITVEVKAPGILLQTEENYGTLSQNRSL
jgi:hypothetical protein